MLYTLAFVISFCIWGFNKAFQHLPLPFAVVDYPPGAEGLEYVGELKEQMLLITDPRHRLTSAGVVAFWDWIGRSLP